MLIDKELGTKYECVWGDGPIPAKLMVIGEAGGADEFIIGRPFVGRCGQLLDKMLKIAKIDREKAYVTNTVKFACRDGNRNRPPKKSEIKECSAFLYREIEQVRPKYILTLGNIPSKLLLRLKATEKLGDHVGREYKCYHKTTDDGMMFDYRLIPCWHPSYLLVYGREYTEQTQEILNDLGVLLNENK